MAAAITNEEEKDEHERAAKIIKMSSLAMTNADDDDEPPPFPHLRMEDLEPPKYIYTRDQTHIHPPTHCLRIKFESTQRLIYHQSSGCYLKCPLGKGFYFSAWAGREHPVVIAQGWLPDGCTGGMWSFEFGLPIHEGLRGKKLHVELIRAPGAADELEEKPAAGPSHGHVIVGVSQVRLYDNAGRFCRYSDGPVAIFLRRPLSPEHTALIRARLHVMKAN